MPRSLCFLLVLAALACGSGLAFVAAAAQAAGPPQPPPLLAAAAATPSAAGGESAIESGERVGDILKSWGTALLLGVAGIMGLAAVAKRNLGEGITLLVITVVVGGFVFAPDAVKAFIQSLWQPISGG